MDVLIGKVARELAALEEQMERAFERAFETGVQLPLRSDSFRPPIDVYETRSSMVVRVDLAGVTPEDVRLVVDGEYLQISGRRDARYDEPPDHHLQMEIPQGAFRRVLRLRSLFDAEHVTATLEAGILRIDLPRKDPAPHRIPVRSK